MGIVKQHRVWIELEKPKDAKEAAEVCSLANKMIDRLVGPVEKGVERSHFWWSERESLYCFGSNWGYISLKDWGHWFHLNHFGRD